MQFSTEPKDASPAVPLPLTHKRRSFWGSIWACESKQDVYDTLKRRDQVDFITGSNYKGQWNTLGMTGYGIFTMPHGVEYEGEIESGVFHGEGTLTYPEGTKVCGEWKRGAMSKCNMRYCFHDGLEYNLDKWNYCRIPDRRYEAEMAKGMQPAGRSYRTPQMPTRVIPPGCYDAGDGFYNPKTHCVHSAETGKLVRIPKKSDEKWIVKHCRRAWDESSGYRPEFYENWRNAKLNEYHKMCTQHNS